VHCASVLSTLLRVCYNNRRRKEKESFYAVVRRQREHDIALKKLHSALSQQDKQDNIERYV
jgi:hypothetical protein